MARIRLLLNEMCGWNFSLVKDIIFEPFGLSNGEVILKDLSASFSKKLLNLRAQGNSRFIIFTQDNQ